MKEIQFNTIQAFNDFHGFETLHPLISVAHFDRETEVEGGRVKTPNLNS